MQPRWFAANQAALARDTLRGITSDSSTRGKPRTSCKLFYVRIGTNRALTLASSRGDLQPEARDALAKSCRSRFLWIEQHRSRLPAEAQPIAARVVTVEFTCWAAVVMLFVLYGLQFVAR